MQRKFIITSLLVLVLAIFSTGYLAIYIGNRYYTESTNKMFRNEVLLVAKEFKDKNPVGRERDILAEELAGTIDSRVTLINMQGTVIVDTEEEISKMENHSNRPEFIKAKNNIISYEERYSKTLRDSRLYVAIRLTYEGFDGVLRISAPSANIKKGNNVIADITSWIIIIAVILSLIGAKAFKKQFTKPIKEITESVIEIADGQYNKGQLPYQYPEFYELNEAFSRMRKRLSQTVNKLADSNGNMKAILDSSPNGVLAIGKNQQVILANEKVKKLLNLKEVSSKGFFSEYFTDIQLIDMVQEAIKRERYGSIEIKRDKKILKVTSTPIYTGNDMTTSIGVLIMVQNMTQLMKLEKMRTDFVTNVSHEIKTPLTSIRGFIETLRSGNVEDSQTREHFLNIIDVESERLFTLVQDLLALSEIETSQEDLDLQVIELQSLYHEVYHLLVDKAHQKDLEIHLDMPEEIIFLEGNHDRLKQVLINLTSNAIKYTNEGYVTMKLRADDHNVKMNIIDTGIGIPKGYQSRIFERFYRVDKSRSRKLGGTGLGLSIVKNIVMLYGGQINVISQIGVGSNFQLTFRSTLNEQMID